MKHWPSGIVAVQSWLSEQGISPLLTTWYLRSGWIESVGRGAYKKAGDNVSWAGGLYAIQRYLKKDIHVGAKTALEILGQSHFLKLGSSGAYFLFGPKKELLPAWFQNKNYWDINTVYLSTSLFQNDSLGILERKVDNIPIFISSPERAMLEVLYLIPKYQTFEESYLLMENLSNMRPKVTQSLLETCNSIKVKRLFMHLAEECRHPFVKHLNLDKVNFGHGKRVIAGGGVYYDKYQLSLPEIKEQY